MRKYLSSLTCPICKKPIYHWQRVDWAAILGQNIHHRCGEAFDEMSTQQKMALKEELKLSH